MHRGYVKLWRKIEDNWLWKIPRKFSKLEAWIDIIMQVQWNPEPEEVVIKNKVLICNRGESLKSLETWAKRWNWDKSATRRFFKILQKTGQIDTQSDTITTRLKVINYETYCPLRNANDTELNSERNASETHLTPDNNIKKVKKVKNTNNRAHSWPKEFILDTQKRKYAVNNGIDPKKVDAFFIDFHDWAHAKGATYKDWDAAFRNRVRKAQEYGRQFLADNNKSFVDPDVKAASEQAYKRLEKFRRSI